MTASLFLILAALAQADAEMPPPLRTLAQSYAFEFAPPTGTGMGGSCACSTPTGSKGEALTFTRNSSANCMKGNWSTGIANGDMVTCSTNQPLISPKQDGTGPLGFVYEPARTNSALRSEAFDNAAWTKTNSVAVAPVVTADQAVAPDGTMTADRVQFAAATGSQYSVITQTAGTGAHTDSVYIKGNASSGTIDLDCHNGASDQCVACAFVAGSWTRCTCSRSSGTPLLIIGNYPAGCTTARSAADVFLWGGDIESGIYATSYISTTGSSATRAASTLTVLVATLNSAGVSNADGCYGVDVYQPTTSGTAGLGCGVSGGAAGGRLPFIVQATRQVRAFDGANQNSSTALSVGARFDALLSLAARWKTGTGINSWSSSISDGTINATYADNAVGSGGGAVYTIGDAQAGCSGNDSYWLTRVRMDTYARACH